jgi:hypothetical protein
MGVVDDRDPESALNGSVPEEAPQIADTFDSYDTAFR